MDRPTDRMTTDLDRQQHGITEWCGSKICSTTDYNCTRSPL